MWLIKLLLFIVALAVLVGFILYNPDPRVSVFFPWKSYYDIPLTFVCFWAFALGMIVSFVYSVFHFIKVAGDIREKNRQIRSLEMELSALRTRALEDLEVGVKEQEG